MLWTYLFVVSGILALLSTALVFSPSSLNKGRYRRSSGIMIMASIACFLVATHKMAVPNRETMFLITAIFMIGFILVGIVAFRQG